MSINKQCKLLGVPRSSYYHKPTCKWNLEDELLMQAIDRIDLVETIFDLTAVNPAGFRIYIFYVTGD